MSTRQRLPSLRVDGYLLPKDIAKHLDVSYVTVINYIKRGQLKAFKIGGRWKIRAKDYEEFLTKGNRREE